MGARLVSAVYAMYPGLPHRAKHAAVVMALKALDEPHDDTPAARYFAGPEPIADALGFARGADGQHTTATLRTVARVMAELREAGVFEVRSHGRNGRRAVYDLHLDPLAPPSMAVAAGLQHGRGGQAQHGRGGPRSMAVAATPTSHEEPPRNQDEDNHPSVLHLTSDPDASADDEFDAARTGLDRMGADAYGAALERAQREHPEASDHELVILAAGVSR